KLGPVVAKLVQIAQTAASFRGTTEKLVEVLELKDSRLRILRDEIEHAANSQRLAVRGIPVRTAEAGGDAPGPDRNLGPEKFPRRILEDLMRSRLLGGANVDQWAARLNQYAK